MIRGLYTSALGMAVQMKRLDVVGNNIANADTPGFKRDIVITQAFSDVMMQRVRDFEMRGINTTNTLGATSLGLIVNNMHRDFSAGNLTASGSPLDLALNGNGFFQIEHTNAEGETAQMFSRGGSFTLTNEGVLVTLSGQPVLNVGGSQITIPPGNLIEITFDGAIIVDGIVVDTLGIVAFEDETMLRPFGDNLYTAIEEAVITPFNGQVLQGFVETSNVNIVREMVEMITISRAYEANSRMLAIADQTLEQAIREVGRR